MSSHPYQLEFQNSTMIQNDYDAITSTQMKERKYSTRLANKRKEMLGINSEKFPLDCKLELNNVLANDIVSGQLISSKNDICDSEKLKNSKHFLDCLELTPVKNESDLFTENSSDANVAFNVINAAEEENIERPKRKKRSVRQVKNKISASRGKQRIKHNQNLKNKGKNTDSDTRENVDIALNTKLNSSCNKTNKKIQNTQDVSDIGTISPKVHKSPENVFTSPNKESKKSDTWNQIFQDVNPIAPIEEKNDSKDDSEANSLLSAVDLNRHGKKRRYDKLMKKLEDGERTIESNLKDVRLLGVDDGNKEDIDQCVEKLKEKLQVREKKKYEYLINYMRDQWKVDQQSFQYLLPQKVEQVKANVVKQLGAHTDKAVAEKRVRGRPKKITCPDLKKEIIIEKKPRLNQEKKKGSSAKEKSSSSAKKKSSSSAKKKSSSSAKKKSSSSAKKKSSSSTKKKSSGSAKKKNSSSPRGFPVKFPKSLLSSLPQNRHKFENFRLGIVDKDGVQKIIELNCDTLKGGSLCNNSENETSSDSKLYSLNAVSSSVAVKTPPTTITLPCISSLEKDYELVSLVPSCPPTIGNIRTDQFYIPQSTFDQDGKTGLIIVGPFCMVFEPKPRFVLVSPEQCKKGPTLILRKKIHYPSKTPPRDFRIIKDTSRNVISCEQMSSLTRGDGKSDLACVAHDHDYMTPVKLRDNVRRYCKAVAKHSANAKFINARVEHIIKEEDNLVVTIKGDNLLHRVKHLSSFSHVPMQNNEEGIPIVYSLSQIMTSTLEKVKLIAKREEMIFESKQSGDYSQVLYPLSSMGDVVMEVLIPPGGTEIVQQLKSKQMDDINIIQESVGDIEANINSDKTMPFLISNICIDCDMQDMMDMPMGDLDLKADVKEMLQDMIPIDNAATLDASQQSGLRCCKVCLRLFPSDYVLFSHVRLYHATCELWDAAYLEELRARSRLACPVCCDPPLYFAMPSKLRRHLQQHHGIKHYVATCKFCCSEFLDKNELELHMNLSHSAYSGRSLLTPSHQLVRTEHSLLACSWCDIMFSDRSSLLKHTLKVHPELNQHNLCRLCDKVFDSEPALHKHLKKAHEQTHGGELKCPFCPAWLPNMDLASAHRLALHNGAVPVHCPFCGEGYQSLHPMYNHVRIQHLQTEAHICPECQSSFPSSRMLSEHARKVHLISPRIMKDTLLGANSTTYCCPFCTVSFLRTYDLAVHVINSHRDHLLPSQCHMCMQSFVNDIVMKMHMLGAHGMEVDGGEDSGYYGNEEVVVLGDGADLYAHSDVFVSRMPSRRHVTRHIVDHQDMIGTQEAGKYLEELEERDIETIIYLNERNELVNTGDMFAGCTILEDVQLLGDTADDFSLQAVDYLETLSNDSIAVGADVVADVGMEDRALNRNQDLIGMASQFEIDGVLYELAASQDSSNHYLHRHSDMMSMDSDDLGVPGESMAMDTNDFEQLLMRQQVQ